MTFSQMYPHWQRGAWNCPTKVARIFETFNMLFHVLLHMTFMSGGVSALQTSKTSMRFKFLVQCFNLACYLFRYYWFHYFSCSFVKSHLDVICLTKFRFYLKAVFLTQFRFDLRILLEVLPLPKRPSLNSLNTLLKRSEDGGRCWPLKYIISNKLDDFTVV